MGPTIGRRPIQQKMASETVGNPSAEVQVTISTNLGQKDFPGGLA